jgi:hypothetical protein
LVNGPFRVALAVALWLSLFFACYVQHTKFAQLISLGLVGAFGRCSLSFPCLSGMKVSPEKAGVSGWIPSLATTFYGLFIDFLRE